MCRLLECLEARLAGCEVRGDREGYETLRHQRDNVEGLTWIATDLYVQEKKNTMAWRIHQDLRDELQLWPRAHWFAISACGG